METTLSRNSQKVIAVFLFSVIILFCLLILSNQVTSTVSFIDENLEQAVREKINNHSDPICQTDLKSILELDAAGRQIQNLEGIEKLSRLAVLNLADNSIKDLSPLNNLSMLRSLNLNNNQFCDLKLVNFPSITNLQLRELNLQGNVCENGEKLSDISDVNDLTDLELLDLRNNNIEDITSLANLPKLSSLDLRNNQIRDIEALSQLTNLKELNLRENEIIDVGPLIGLTNLTYLNIHSNPIETNLAGLGNLHKLETLIMRNVPIGNDFHFLENLTRLQRLNIRNTGITDVSIIGKLMANGALQDKPEDGIDASIDLLEINPSGKEKDPYLELRRYWDNISYRHPLSLPYYPSSVSPPVFSHESGFYKEEFYLTLSTNEPDGKIFYTLDGAEPSFTPELTPLGSTTEYRQPIFLQNKSEHPNILSNIRTDSQWGRYVPPSEVFKSNIVRAIVLDNNDNRSNAITHSFFVDDQIDERYSMPIVSISTNPDYFLDDEIGIYVPGNLYKPFGPDQHWSVDQSNFFQRGLKWERPIHFQMIDTLGNTVISQDAGIRIHGNFTRLFNQKSLRLYARKEYSGLDFVEFNFFPELNNRLSNNSVDTFSTLIIRNGGNAWLEAFFRDVLAHSLLYHTNLDIQGFMPVILFINGEYWGIHNIRTRYDEHYFYSYHGVKPDELVVLNNAVGNLYFGEPGDEDDFIELLKLIDENYIENDYQTVDTLSNHNIYEEFVKRIDINNYINYHIAHIYFKNTDWPHNNLRIWRKNISPTNSVSEGSNYGQDGRWRWLFMDADHGFMDPSHNTILHATTKDRYPFSTFLTRSLLENDQFRNQFINTFADHLNTSFREEVVLERIDELEKLYDPEIEEQIHRWGNLGGSYGAWLENVESIREFARLRPMMVRQHIIDYFDLPGLATLTVQTDPTKGYVRINTIDLTANSVGVNDPAQWTGIYFNSIPLEIEAIPFEGYHFVGWEGITLQNEETEASTIIINLESDLIIFPIFEKK